MLLTDDDGFVIYVPGISRKEINSSTIINSWKPLNDGYFWFIIIPSCNRKKKNWASAIASCCSISMMGDYWLTPLVILPINNWSWIGLGQFYEGGIDSLFLLITHQSLSIHKWPSIPCLLPKLNFNKIGIFFFLPFTS